MHDELMGGDRMSREPQQWHMPHALACLESRSALMYSSHCEMLYVDHLAQAAMYVLGSKRWNGITETEPDHPVGLI